MQKFLRTLAIVAAMLLPFAMQAQNSWTVADGTTTHAKVPLDFYNCDGSGNRQAQMLYPASLLTSMNGSTIGAITFYHQNTTANKTLTASTWYIRMAETTETDLSAGLSSQTLTTVYAGNLVVVNGVFSFEFSTPYTYNGGNLIVEIQTSGASGNYFGSSNQGCYGVDNIGSTYSTMSSPNHTAFLPKTTFTEVPSCFPVTNLAIDGAQTTANSLTLTWTDANNTGATYNIYTVTATDTNLLGNVSATTYTATGLDANTVYTFAVAANCGAGDEAVKSFAMGRTGCAVTQALPYVEEFNGYTGFASTSSPYYGPSVLPACWIYYSNGTNTAETSGSSAYYGGVAQITSTSYGSMVSGNPYLYMPIQLTGSAVTSSSYLGYATARGDVRYAVMPAFATPINGLQIGFDYKMSSAYSATGAAAVLELGYVTNDDVTTFVSMWSANAVTATQHVVDLNLSGLAAAAPAGARLAFKFSGVHNGTSTSSYTNVACGIDNIVVENLPSCARVVNLTVSGITNNSVTLNWVDTINTGATYTVSDADGVIATGISAMTYTATGLTGNTDYTFSVVTNCSATEASTATTVNVHTDCDAMTTLPYLQNFEAEATGSSTSAAFAECWNRLNNGTQYFGQPYISSSTTYNHTEGGTKGLYWTNSNSAGTYYGDYQCIVLPSLGGSYSVSDCRLKFWAKESNASYEPVFIVGVLTDAHDINTFVAVDSVIIEGTTWAEYTVNLNGYNGNGTFVAIRANRPASTWYVYVDDILLEEMPSCVEISDLTAGNITANSITLNWTDAVNPSATYTVYDMSDSSVVATGITGTTYTATGLTANTAYTFGVVANCSATESSPVVTVSGHTACEAELLPWTETFAAANAGCWTLVSNNTANASTSTTSSNYFGFTTYSDSTVIVFNSWSTASDYFQYAYSPMLDASALTDADSIQVTVIYATHGTADPLRFGYATTGSTTPSDYTWTAEYSTTGYSDWQTLTFNVPLTANRLAINYTSTGCNYKAYVSTMAVTGYTIPACPAVTALAASNITADGATLTWTGDATSYNVYDNGTLVQNVTTATIDLTNLTANTEYTYGVTADCGTDESDTVFVTFRTACAAFAMPFAENFNTLTSGIPSCWDNSEGTTTSASYKWNYYATGHDGVGLRFNSYSNSNGNTNVLATPVIAIDEAAQLSFWYKNPTGGDFTVMVGVEGSATRTTLATNLTGASDWTLAEYILPAELVDENVVVYFQGTSNWGNGDAYIYLDDVTVGAIPACVHVTGLTATNIEAHGATLTWTGTATGYNVYNMADSTLVQSVADNTVTLTGLSGQTTYTFGVASDCGTEESDTVTVTFTTLISCPAPTGLAATLTPGDGTVATINWHAGDEETAWEICLNGDMTNLISVTDSTYSFTGLTPEVADTVKVRAVCDVDDKSAWTTLVFTPTNAYTITVNDGTATNGFVPVYGLYVDELTKSQFIIPAASLSAMAYGNINKMTFYATQASVDWGVATFNVYLTETNETTLSAYADLTTMTQVYAGSLSIVDNKMEVTFTTPYQYMGGNLQVAFSQTATGQWVTSTWYGVAATGASMSSYGSGSATQRDFLPKTTFAYTPGVAPACMPVSNLTVDSVTATSVFLSWTDADNTGATYSIISDNGSVVATGITTTNYEVTGLTASTTYIFGVVANCSATETSNAATVSATTDCAGGSCTIKIYAQDAWGDGWNGNTITISQNGATVATYSMADQDQSNVTIYDTFSVSVCSGVPVTFSWTSGGSYSYPDEITFALVDGGGAPLYTISDATNLSGTFYTMTDPCPSCMAVSGLTVDSVSTTSVSISWTGTAASYDVYNGSTFVANVTTTNYTFTGLTAGTGYTFGVQAICSATDSAAMMTINAMTACADVTTLPYMEGFENGLGCWSTVNGSADGYPWFTTTSNSNITAHSGNAMAVSVSYYSGAVHANAWMISPKFVLPTIAAGDTLNLAWWHKVSANYPTELYDVMLSTTTADTAAFTTTLLAVNPDSTNDWVNKVVDLSAYAGQSVYIAFHHHDSYDQNYLLIDDISLTVGAAPMPAPDSVKVTVAVNDPTMGTTVPAPGVHYFYEGDVASVVAQPAAGYHLEGWTIRVTMDYSSYGYDTVVAIIDTTLNIAEVDVFTLIGYDTVEAGDHVYEFFVTANFAAGAAEPDTVTLIVNVPDPTRGTTTPAPGTHYFTTGDILSLTAQPAQGYVLADWVFTMINGDGDTVYENENLDSAYAEFFDAFGDLPAVGALLDGYIFNVSPIFAQDTNAPQPQGYTVTVTVNDSAMGYVLGVPTAPVEAGTPVSLTAVANPGYHFVDWSTGETTPTITITVISDITLVANFAANPENTYTVQVVYDDNMGNVTGIPAEPVAAGSPVTLMANALEGYKFVAWLDRNRDTLSKESIYIIDSISEDVYLFAIFDVKVGIEDVTMDNVKVYSNESVIYVLGAEGQNVYVYDLNGRVMNAAPKAGDRVEFRMNNTGVYLVKVGTAAAKRVVVTR
ncbi:MAG: choice-of-anchor J domain-containing protein [Bacteroidales bacterium]|nr:choice-of-anchor J domain-containing protein [Bacteroidales bacterium]